MSTKVKVSDRKFFLAIAVVLILLVLFAGYRTLRSNVGVLVGDFFYPYLMLSRVAASGVSQQSLLLYSRPELAAKLEALAAENRELAARNREIETLSRENQELRKLLELTPPAKWRYLTVPLLVRDPLLWRERLVVALPPDCGAKAGSAVIASAPDGTPALVGVLSRVGNREGDVETLFSPSLRLSAEMRNGSVGFLNVGERRPTPGALAIGHLPAHLKYQPGEPVTTTGYESGIPRGIRIGTLSTVEETDPRFSSVQHLSGLLIPAADFNLLRFLVLILPEE